MTRYSVEVDGTEVWSTETDGYQGTAPFPDEYRGRPASGEVRWLVDGEVISVAVPEPVEG